MELFSEIYSCYYNIVQKLLARGTVSREEIDEMARRYGFAESALFLTPKLTGPDGWQLFEQNGDAFVSRLHDAPDMPVSALELGWLKAVSADKRFRLFFTDAEWEQLRDYLKDVPPLFEQATFYAFDQFSDGDPYDDEDYRCRFRVLLHAIKNHIPLKINYRNKEGLSRQCHCVPLKLDYSARDDKFRLIVGRIAKGNPAKYCTLNLNRITAIQVSLSPAPDSFQAGKYSDDLQCREPVTIEITNERKAIERVLIEFSSYRKTSEYDEKTSVCLTRIYYNTGDETELLIRLLGFGPVLKVVSPPHFVNLMRERVKAQTALLEHTAP